MTDRHGRAAERMTERYSWTGSEEGMTEKHRGAERKTEERQREWLEGPRGIEGRTEWHGQTEVMTERQSDH